METKEFFSGFGKLIVALFAGALALTTIGGGVLTIYWLCSVVVRWFLPGAGKDLVVGIMAFVFVFMAFAAAIGYPIVEWRASSRVKPKSRES